MATKILVVDDDPDCLEQTEERLKAGGYEVATAEGQESVLYEAGILMCYIKKKDPSVPVILVSAVRNETRLDFDTATDEERAWIKADALLDKPVRFEQLIREINRLMGEKQNAENENTHSI